MSDKVRSYAFFLAAAAAAAFSDCAGTQVQNQGSLLTAAGFGALTSATEPQSGVYNRLTPYKLERNTITGKVLYTYADKQKGVVYVGGDKAYEAIGSFCSSSRWLKKSLRPPTASTLRISIRTTA